MAEVGLAVKNRISHRAQALAAFKEILLALRTRIDPLQQNVGTWRSLVTAPALGAGSRRFESARPDHKRVKALKSWLGCS